MSLCITEKLPLNEENWGLKIKLSQNSKTTSAASKTPDAAT